MTPLDKRLSDGPILIVGDTSAGVPEIKISSLLADLESARKRAKESAEMLALVTSERDYERSLVAAWKSVVENNKALLEEAVEVIEFYADERHWHSNEFDDRLEDEEPIGFEEDDAQMKPGKRARAFLSKLKEAK